MLVYHQIKLSYALIEKNSPFLHLERLIHRLSEMSDIELTKVEQLLDVVFDRSFKSSERAELSRNDITTEEQSLDRSIQEAKNKLYAEQLEKRIEQFKQSKKTKSG